MQRARASGIVAFFAFVVSIAAPASALCVSGIPLCQSFWGYEAVFEGTVLSIDQKAASDPATPFKEIPESLRPPFRIVTFEVVRSWRGDRGPRISLIIAGGRAGWVEDLVDYARGGRYLVFAYRVAADGNILSTSACAPGTRLGTTDASEARAFLESISHPSAGGRVFGRIFDEGTFIAGRARTPTIETHVSLAGDRFTRSETSTNGTFDFADVPPGRYTLTADLPDGFTGSNLAEFDIPDAHGCFDRSFLFRRRGELR